MLEHLGQVEHTISIGSNASVVPARFAGGREAREALAVALTGRRLAATLERCSHAAIVRATALAACERALSHAL